MRHGTTRKQRTAGETMRLGYDTAILADGREVRFVRGADERHHETCGCGECPPIAPHGPRHNCAACAERYAAERREAMRAAFAFDRKPALATHFACAVCGAARDEECRTGCDCVQCNPASHG